MLYRVTVTSKEFNYFDLAGFNRTFAVSAKSSKEAISYIKTFICDFLITFPSCFNFSAEKIYNIAPPGESESE